MLNRIGFRPVPERAFDTASQVVRIGHRHCAEILKIDNHTYVGPNITFLEANGGNAWADAQVTGTVTPSTDGSTYASTVARSGSPTVVRNVYPSGIVRDTATP